MSEKEIPSGHQEVVKRDVATHMPTPVGLMPIRESVQKEMAEMCDREIADRALRDTSGRVDPEYYAELLRRNLSGRGMFEEDTYRLIGERERCAQLKEAALVVGGDPLDTQNESFEPYRLRELMYQALSTQLTTLTGDSYNIRDFKNRDNDEELTAKGVIVHKKTGLQFEVPDVHDESLLLTYERISFREQDLNDAGFGATLTNFMTENESSQLSRAMQAMPMNFNARNALSYLRDRTLVDSSFMREILSSFTPESDTSVIEALKENVRFEFLDDVLAGRGVFIEGVNYPTIQGGLTPFVCSQIRVGVIGTKEHDKNFNDDYVAVEQAFNEMRRLRTEINRSPEADFVITPLSRMTMSEGGRPALSEQGISTTIRLKTKCREITIEISKKDNFMLLNHGVQSSLLSDKAGTDYILGVARSDYIRDSGVFEIKSSRIDYDSNSPAGYNGRHG